MGRPFGPPSDPAFQKRVILAALRLLESERGPVVIEDFADDDPRAGPDPAWRRPLLPSAAGEGSTDSLGPVYFAIVIGIPTFSIRPIVVWNKMLRIRNVVRSHTVSFTE